ncbi:hypothetical protein KCU90_g171, partial [Aureobasidium melanogenum]
MRDAGYDAGDDWTFASSRVVSSLNGSCFFQGFERPFGERRSETALFPRSRERDLCLQPATFRLTAEEAESTLCGDSSLHPGNHWLCSASRHQNSIAFCFVRHCCCLPRTGQTTDRLNTLAHTVCDSICLAGVDINLL